MGGNGEKRRCALATVVLMCAGVLVSGAWGVSRVGLRLRETPALFDPALDPLATPLFVGGATGRANDWQDFGFVATRAAAEAAFAGPLAMLGPGRGGPGSCASEDEPKQPCSLPPPRKLFECTVDAALQVGIETTRGHLVVSSPNTTSSQRAHSGPHHHPSNHNLVFPDLCRAAALQGACVEQHEMVLR